MSDGLDEFWAAITSPQAVAALQLTFTVSAAVTLINALIGTLIAWVLVRDDFAGKPFVNALIDLPFALPTIVAGLTLLALYGPQSPFGINVAYSQPGIMAGPALHHAALRGARGAAGPRGARPRDGGGGGLAGRVLADGPAARRPAQPRCRPS